MLWSFYSENNLLRWETNCRLVSDKCRQTWTMMCFLENISQKLIRLHRRLVVACSAPSLADGLGGKTVESPLPGWCLGVTTVWPNCLLSLQSLHPVTALLCLTSSPDTFRQDEDKKWKWWVVCLMLRCKINGGCWPKRINYSRTIKPPRNALSLRGCFGR